MGETFDLFSNDPLAVAKRRSSVFRPGFVEWLEENEHVYREFERRALQVAGFRDHYGARTIIEVMRHETAIRQLGDEYKLNDHMTPDLARLFSMCNPNHASLFEFRTRKAA